jgi:alpha-L-arabinofuranosidase
MNRVLAPRPARRGRRSPDARASTVSVLRWPAGRSADGVFEMFSAREADRLGPLEPESLDSAYARENILLVSATRRVAPDSPAVQLSLVNTSLSQAVKLSVKLAGRPPTSMAGSVLTAPSMAVRDGFEALNVPQPATFHGAVLKANIVEITVPARSVVVLTLQ